ncbi:MAG: DUF2934 domain-containing protein [Alphaproteobacteria bacterium]|nr:DUF2934 domain-containing protein [Alphaproteobacteria bacterium]
MAKLNEENIRVAAYYLWEQAGRPDGSGEEFWAKACKQLFGKSVKTAPAKAQKKSLNKPAASGAAKPAAAQKPAGGQPFYGIRKK